MRLLPFIRTMLPGFERPEANTKVQREVFNVNLLDSNFEAYRQSASWIVFSKAGDLRLCKVAVLQTAETDAHGA
ncbi:hypothetical protein ACMU_18090 [Actibacterium mucosum KCTC 23349]|uniref:Uncharacterized protein n=1 Tax=Actibacterium mucosum KCTC 23349 TaxID=1454373 RepID=A0A037ZHS0_9RHOB|nr:hypothetical protein ACMU_18090 [Actibacterium mucosum KCTC 23349]